MKRFQPRRSRWHCPQKVFDNNHHLLTSSSLPTHPPQPLISPPILYDPNMTATNFAPAQDLAPLTNGPSSTVSPSGSAQARAETLLKSVTSVQEREGACCLLSPRCIFKKILILVGYIYFSQQSWPMRCWPRCRDPAWRGCRGG